MHAFTPRGVQGALRFHDLPGRGVPLVFLHGMGCASSADYPEVASAPPLRARRCILIDLLGSGFSDRPSRFPYTVESHAQVLVQLFRRLRLERFCLYGHSMSGAVAIVAASALPRQVTRLVLSEPNLDPGGGTMSRAIAAQPVKQYLSRGHARLVRTSRLMGKDLWSATLAGSSPIAIHRAAVSLVAGSQPPWREVLAGLPMPRTVIFGTRSLPDPDTRRLRASGVAVRVVPDAGHDMAAENPGGLARALAAAIA